MHITSSTVSEHVGEARGNPVTPKPARVGNFNPLGRAMKSSRIGVSCLITLFLLLSLTTIAQDSKQPAVNNPQILVFVQRAQSHVKFSKSEVFHDVLDDLLGYLKTKNVAMATDEFGGRTNSEDQMPLSTVQGIARDSGAKYLLYTLVERPVMKWIKVTVTCYDMSGQKLWEDQAESGGGMSGGHGLRVTLDRLHENLDKRVGQAGLPLLTPIENAKEIAGPAK
jgi:hypothetical protein